MPSLAVKLALCEYRQAHGLDANCPICITRSNKRLAEARAQASRNEQQRSRTIIDAERKRFARFEEQARSRATIEVEKEKVDLFEEQPPASLRSKSDLYAALDILQEQKRALGQNEAYLNAKLEALVRAKSEREKQILKNEALRLSRPSIIWTSSPPSGSDENSLNSSDQDAARHLGLSFMPKSRLRKRAIEEPPAPLVYRPMKKGLRQIRLLRLQAAAKMNAPVRCRIETYTLSQATKTRYETISYVWGLSNFNGRIEIDHHDGRQNGFQTVAVPLSAEEALRTIRKVEEDRLVWLDSVCIDQSNQKEKESQVQMMGEIYASAQRTLVWLSRGRGERERIQPAMDAIYALSRQMQDAAKSHEALHNVLSVGTMPTSMSDVLAPGIDSDALNNLMMFYNSPWFTRLWIVQEAALSRSGICYYGRRVIELVHVLRAACWLVHKHEIARNHKGINNAASIWYHADDEFGTYTNRRHVKDDNYNALGTTNRKVPSLGALLCNFMDFETSEPKDKIFGLVGMSRWSVYGKALPASLQPNYHKPLTDIYRDVTRLAIEDAGNLNVLQRLSHRYVGTNTSPELVDLPSWVPRWHQPFLQELDPYGLGRCFSADAKSHMHFFDVGDSDPNCITLQGLDHDAVFAQSDVLMPSDLENVSKACNIIREKLLPLVEERASDPTVMEALVETLVAGVLHGQPVSRPATWLRPCWLAFQRYLDRDVILPNTGASNASLISHRKPEDFLEAMCRACAHRRFFISVTGKMGLAPSGTNVGDRVCILYGGMWPFVLRPNGGSFQLIGPAYVHGLMHGEAVNGQSTTYFQVR